MRLTLITVLIIFISTYIIAEDTDFPIISKEIKNEKRVALVIGNSTYQRPFTVLNNTINDAQAIRTILSNRGFDVIYKENISLRDFNNVLEKFYQKLGNEGVGLLYFSGHGIEFNGQNYLIPTNANIKINSDAQYEAVPLNKITHQLQQVENRLNIIILDACRNDPFAKAYGVGGLREVAPIGLFVAYATGAGQISSDGQVGGHGLFTQYLIENMKKPLNLQDVFKATRALVYEKSEGIQFPAIYDQIVKGDFYFTLPNNNLTATPIPETLSEYTPVFRVYAKSDINRQKTINASIVIKNKGIWESGMKFKKGKYLLTVSAKDYKTQSYPIIIESNKGFDFQLPLIEKEIKQSSYSSKQKTNAELREEGKIIPHPKSEIDILHNEYVRYDNRFSKKSINTVLDHKTGLVWPKSLVQNPMNLNDAKKYCKNLSLDGFNNWRLPTIEELRTFLREELHAPVPNSKYFYIENYLSNFPIYWSSNNVKTNREYDIISGSFYTVHNPPYSECASFGSDYKKYLKLKNSSNNTPLCIFTEKEK